MILEYDIQLNKLINEINSAYGAMHSGTTINFNDFSFVLRSIDLYYELFSYITRMIALLHSDRYTLVSPSPQIFSDHLKGIIMNQYEQHLDRLSLKEWNQDISIASQMIKPFRLSTQLDATGSLLDTISQKIGSEDTLIHRPAQLEGELGDDYDQMLILLLKQYITILLLISARKTNEEERLISLLADEKERPGVSSLIDDFIFIFNAFSKSGDRAKAGGGSKNTMPMSDVFYARLADHFGTAERRNSNVDAALDRTNYSFLYDKLMTFAIFMDSYRDIDKKHTEFTTFLEILKERLPNTQFVKIPVLQYALFYFRQVYNGYQGIGEIEEMQVLFGKTIGGKEELPKRFRRKGDISLIETKIKDVVSSWGN